MKKERKAWAMTFIVPWLLAPGIIQAQTDSASTTTLNEVVVTATKFPKNVDQTGQVLTVISHQTLEQSTGKDLAQVLNEQTGITVVGGTSNPGKDKALSLQGASNDYTLILVDGIPMNDPSGLGGAYDLRMIPLDNIDRIEILKGSQSTLYGSDAIAGVVNIITKERGVKPAGVNGGLSYGSYNTSAAQVNLAGSGQKVDYNFGYSRFHSGGLSEAAKPDTVTTTYDRDPSTQQGFNGSGTFKPTDKFSITPWLRYSTFDGKYDAGAYADSRLDKYSSNLWSGGLRAEAKTSVGSLGILYGYEHSERTYNDDFGIYNYKGAFQNADIFFNAPFSKSVSLLTGINGQLSKLVSQDPAQSINLWSPYALLTYDGPRGISLGIGGRLNFHSVYGHNETFSFNPSWLIAERFKLFYNLSSGFKAPDLSQLYSPFATADGLQPEKSLSQEFGVELETLNKQGTIRFVGFRRKVRDLITYVSTPQGAIYTNIDEQRDNGVEAEVNWILNRSVELSTFYAFATGKLSTDAGNTSYNLFRRPKNSFGCRVSMRMNRWSTNLGLKYNGEREDQFYDNNFILQEASLNGYALLNIHLEYDLWKEHLQVFINGRNLLDSDYQETYGYSTPGINGDLGLRFNLP